MEQAGTDRGHIHAQFRQDYRDLGDMREIGFTRLAALWPVRFFRKVIGTPNEVGIDFGKIPADTRYQLDRARYGGRRRCQFW